jgi:protein tyrosine phosphatase (PTP) superfamily phosphohydrolase (DUF442 family)
LDAGETLARDGFMAESNAMGQDGEARPIPLTPIPRAGFVRWSFRGLILLIGGLAVCWLGNVLVGQNLHTVIPGRIYRGAQPTADALERIVRMHGIRTIVNLRGCCNPLPWYLAEGRVAQQLGVCQEDVAFSAVHLPPPTELRQLVEVLERAEYPIFLHCRHGADRTGLAAVVALLLQPDVAYAHARRELGLYHGHLSFGKTGYLDTFFDLYENWLHEQGKEHSPELFRHWVLEVYRGGWCEGGVERVEPLQPAKANRPIGFRVRVHNRSTSAWQFKPTVNAGMHIFFRVWDAEGNPKNEGRAGMLDATVPPGEKFDVTMVVPPLPAGRYWLAVDMVEEFHVWFCQLGPEPWEEEFVVRE